MWLKNLFADRKGSPRDPERDPLVNRGVFYLYLILGIQIFIVFGILAGIMVIGQVLATPMWMFIAAFAAGVWGLVFIYRKTKQKLEKIRDAISRVDLSDKNLELSFMGGVLTMRIEQNGRTPLLEAPSSSSAIIDAEPLESTAPR
ncbi:MAG: hypothetical protein MUF52_04160 [Syntrophobacteraceae bacterium]|nr:hypothetical protein [Syntrophobacteraceae bacterium]